jgi:dephospho-CoA kinase
MLSIGLTGGIGAGKSAVAAAFARRGALIIDADRIAREVVEPGTSGLAAVAAEFGPGVIAPDGTLDRAALAALVFGDPSERQRLEAIVHPRVAAESAALMAAAGPGTVTVHDVPLLVEAGLADRYDVVVVVESPLEVRRRRLREDRGMSDADIDGRLAAQAGDDERRAVADHVIVNDADLDTLDARVGAVWDALVAGGTPDDPIG